MTEFLNRATDWLRTNIRLSAGVIYLGALGLTALVFVGFLLFNIFAKKRGKAAARGYFGSVIVIASVGQLISVIMPNDYSRVTSYYYEVFTPTTAIVLGGILSIVLAVVSKPRRKKEAAVSAENAAPVNAAENNSADNAPPAGEIKEEPAAETPVVIKEAEPEPVAEPPVFIPDNQEPVNPEKEDIIVKIERITAAGASKQTMLEIAKLLQAERAKAENKAPEQQRRLNSALATILKALSSAN